MMQSETYSVFLVDDDPLFLKSLEHHLLHTLKHSVHIRSFDSGEDCLRHLDQKPDIVVLDYVLNEKGTPDKLPHTGLSVLRKIKDLYPSTTVIMLSGQERVEVAVETIRHGAYDYVIKNENAFIKINNLLRNAMASIALRKQVKDYSFWVKAIVVAIIVLIIVAVATEIFFSHVLR